MDAGWVGEWLAPASITNSGCGEFFMMFLWPALAILAACASVRVLKIEKAFKLSAVGRPKQQWTGTKTHP